MPRAVFLALFLALLSRTLRAQDASDSAAYRALTQTPIAAVPMSLHGTMDRAAASGVAVTVRYAIMSFADSDYVNNIVVGGDLRLGAGRFGLAAGGYLPTCDRPDCRRHFMAEATFAERLTSLAMGRDSSRATLHVGIALGVAVGTPSGTTLVATALRLPIALASSDRGVRLVPYVEPGLGTGLVHGHGLTDAGLRAMFGAGVAALGLGDGVMVHAGVHRVFMPDGNWLAGIGLTYAAPR